MENRIEKLSGFDRLCDVYLEAGGERVEAVFIAGLGGESDGGGLAT
jgi:hypothetical protein